MFVLPLIRTLRPYQWYKNLLLFVGLIFSYNLSDTDQYLRVLMGFIFFCLMAGSIYIMNDVVDEDKDKRHPIKCKRPIASGDLQRNVAILFMVVFAVGCPLGAYFIINPYFSAILVIYFLLFVIYSYVLKYVVILDVFTIGAGFVIRAIAGIVAVKEAQVSWWLIICTLFLALFLALGKRRAEMVGMGTDKARNYRSVYSVYTVEMLNHFITLAAAAMIVVYCLYSAMAPHKGMVLTIPFVIFGVIKYMQLMYTDNFGAEPEKVFSNGFMVGNLLLWGSVVVFVLYGKVEIVLDFIEF